MDIESKALHEFGHWLSLRHTDPIVCDPICVMSNPWYSNFVRRSPCSDEENGANTIYLWTSVDDLYMFTATPGAGQIQLDWWVNPGPYSHSFRVYGKEEGQPYVLVYEGSGSPYEEHFTYADNEVVRGLSYSYVIWCDNGFARTCGPAVATGIQLAEYSTVSCEEVVEGVRVEWTTTYEGGALDGFDVYRAPDWEWLDDGTRYIEAYAQISPDLLPASGPGEYEYIDMTAPHGRKYSYLVMGRAGSSQRRAGPACNACWRPYLPQCEFAFAPNQPDCPQLCPAGDLEAPVGGRPPIKLEITLRDSCGFPVEENDDLFVWLIPSVDGTSRLCCEDTEETVQSPQVMLPGAATDAGGRAWVDVWWGGGSDTLLTIAAYTDGPRMLPDVLQTQVRSPDMNADCIVDPLDFGHFAPWFGSSAPGSWVADFNCDGVVDPIDFVTLSTHFGHECGSSRTLPIPPELLAKLGSGDWSDLATDRFSASPNTPNPFNPVTHISYEVPIGGAHVSIVVFDLAGRQVKTLINDNRPGGEHQATWDGTNEQGQQVPSGVYFYRIDTPGFSDMRKMVLVK